MRTNLEELNILLSDCDLPDHRKIVSSSLSNICWLKKHYRESNLEILRLIHLNSDKFKLQYKQPETSSVLLLSKKQSSKKQKFEHLTTRLAVNS